jgi:hypothetical protein
MNMDNRSDEAMDGLKSLVCELMGVAEPLIYRLQVLDELGNMRSPGVAPIGCDRETLGRRRREVRAELAELMGRALGDAGDPVGLLCAVAVSAYRQGRVSLRWLPDLEAPASEEGGDAEGDGRWLTFWLGLTLARDALIRQMVEEDYGPATRAALVRIGDLVGVPRVMLLDPAQRAALERAGARSGAAAGDLVRRAIDAYLSAGDGAGG